MSWTIRLLAPMTALLAACSSKPAAPPQRGGRQALVYTVDVIPVEAKKVDYIVQAPGTIDAFERVQVTARVAGVVDRVLFAEGQEVKKGTPLVSIDSEHFRLATSQAKAGLDKANATQSDAEAMVARREAATKDHPGLIPGEEIASDKTKVLTAKADSEAAAQALRDRARSTCATRRWWRRWTASSRRAPSRPGSSCRRATSWRRSCATIRCCCTSRSSPTTRRGSSRA